MELCYDGALVMPSNYAVMDEEEMTYVEGGSLYTIPPKVCSDISNRLCTGAGGAGAAATVLAGVLAFDPEFASKIGAGVLAVVCGALGAGAGVWAGQFGLAANHRGMNVNWWGLSVKY